MKRAPLLFILPLLVLCASAASAAESETPQPPASDAHLRGVELALRPSIGSAGADSPVTAEGGKAPMVFRSGASPFKVATAVGMQVGWRFHPFVSAGFRFDIGRVSGEAPADGTKDLGRETMGAGLYSRIYPFAMNESVRRHVDPWISIGAGYARDLVSFTRPEETNRGTIDAKWQADRHAIAIPIGIGIDYRATEWLSVGPSFEYAIMNPIAGCAKVSAAGIPESKICTEDSKEGLVASTAGVWNAGLTLRVTPF